jgi:hypothetical protein
MNKTQKFDLVDMERYHQNKSARERDHAEQALAALVDVAEVAILAGHWTVDPLCDPKDDITEARQVLKHRGWTFNGTAWEAPEKKIDILLDK